MDYKNNCQYSVANMLSERHDNNGIGYWLEEWKKTKVPTPKIIVTNQSMALMMDVVKTFTQFYTLKIYFEVCSLLINKRPREFLLECFVMILIT